MPFIFSSIKRELLTPYLRSRAGGLWSLIHPLVMVLIYALILSEILSAKLPGIENRFAYTLYLLAGMIPWVYFNEMITRGLNLFLANAHLIKKLYFKHSALVWIYLGICGLNHLIFLTLVIIGYIFLGHPLSWETLWILVLWIPLTILGSGIGLLAGLLNIFLRDIGQLVPIILQLTFWLTPIVYMPAILPERYQSWLQWHPFYALVNGYQKVLLWGESPDWQKLLYPLALGVALLVLGAFLYKRSKKELVDML